MCAGGEGDEAWTIGKRVGVWGAENPILHNMLNGRIGVGLCLTMTTTTQIGIINYSFVPLLLLFNILLLLCNSSGE